MQHFVETIEGRHLNLAHVVRMRHYKDGVHCYSAEDETLGVIGHSEAFEISDAIVANTQPGVALIAFYDSGTGGVEWVRHPIIAWAIVRRSAHPIIADNLDEPWCIEYQNTTKPTYLFPWLCTCDTWEAAMAYAAEQLQEEEKRRQAKIAKHAAEAKA